MKRDFRILLRFAICWLFFVLILLSMLWRALNLATWDPYKLKDKQSTLIHKRIVHKAPRGELIDRESYPLAMNVPRYRVYLDLARVVLNDDQKTKLAEILDKNLVEFLKNIDKNKDKYLLLGNIDHSQKMRLSDEGILGLHYEELATRYYPLGAAAAQLVGRVDREGFGVDGLEKLYNQHLIGKDGEQYVRQDRMGHAITPLSIKNDMQQGQSIQLTLDHRIQQYVYRELLSQVQSTNAQGGAVVVLNHQGDIIAMASAPSYNPNIKLDKLDARMSNRSVVDVFEPGSSIKPIAFVGLLPYLNKNKIVDTEGGRYRLGKFIIKDVKDYGSLSLTESMVYSSNVAMIKLAKEVGGNTLLKTYQAFKLFEPTYAELLGEHASLNVANIKPGSIDYYALSYGYGLQISLLQLAHAYLILSNEGFDPGVHLIDIKQRARSQPIKVASSKTIQDVTKMMVKAVEVGTGKLAKMDGIEIAGKTGTSQRAISGSYTEKKHISTFAGFGPVNAAIEDRYTIAVVIFEPEVGKHFGGMAATPLFAKIMNYVLSMSRADHYSSQLLSEKISVLGRN